MLYNQGAKFQESYSFVRIFQDFWEMPPLNPVANFRFERNTPPLEPITFLEYVQHVLSLGGVIGAARRVLQLKPKQVSYFEPRGWQRTGDSFEGFKGGDDPPTTTGASLLIFLMRICYKR
ncbi:hypothetical protein EVAR_101162_1 [Eumeta japonica]|uniref:Uncharacterized protein n=1 Tax=Eumeta variegata TaxID=151549 RepID=A0A4C1SE12_EUMVA|nr:hypothetical protein EVAR_101162_1 [Eumeta japonica]